MIDNRPRGPKTPGKKWQRPWAVRDDFRSDDAFVIPAPSVLSGEMLDVSFATDDPTIEIAFGSGFYGPVVDVNLARDLFGAWRRESLAHPERKVDAVASVHFPGVLFVPIPAHTRRGVDGRMVESGIEVMTFWARPRYVYAPRGKKSG